MKAILASYTKSLFCFIGFALVSNGCHSPGFPHQASKIAEACCEKPTFGVWLHPKSGDEPYVQIIEQKGVVKIRVELDGEERSISRLASYHRLKTLITKSNQWKSSARETSRLNGEAGLYFGEARDILSVTAGTQSAVFQGNRVPVEWKRQIQALASDAAKSESREATAR